MSSSINAEKLRARDQEALEALFSKLAPLIRASLGRFRPQQSELDPDDVVAEVFLQLLKNPERLADMATAGTLERYCVAIARNMMVHMWRRERKAANSVSLYETALERSEQQVADLAIDAEARERLERALTALGEIPRQVILMHLEGHSLNEIAKTLGVSPAVVRVRHSRAVKLLRQALVEHKESPGR